MKAKVINANPKLLDVIDVVRTRSSDSTESINNSLSKTAISAMGAVAHALDWRNKEETSIFRSRSADIPDMFAIQRCNAFEEDSDDEDESRE